MNIRENWRIVMLVIFTITSAIVLFGPIALAGSDSGATNLQYGLELSGGTRIRAPLIGLTATGADIAPQESRNVSQELTEELNVSLSDVQVLVSEQQDGSTTATVEVFERNVSEQEFRTALDGLGVQYSDVRDGVTETTRQETVRILQQKINNIGLSGGTVSTASTGSENFVLVEVPNANRQEVVDLIGSRGTVELVASYPVQEGNETVYRQQTVLTREGIAQVSPAQRPSGQGANRQAANVPVTLTQAAAGPFADAMVELGFVDAAQSQGSRMCTYVNERDGQNLTGTGYCLLTVTDGEVVHGAGINPGLAEDFQTGEFEDSRSFIMQTGDNFSEAQELQVDLQAGELPTNLNISGGTTYTLQPSLASDFKFFSLLAGFIAWFGVAAVVFYRYGSPKVAVPMLVTAGAEVFLLLGFSAAVGLALDLSHIAGFIAVIGTGVDDLIIIADEILQSGEVATGRVFQSRFRKAFWVIGAAAATTAIAMSPLAVLSLGDLRGFAIVTIVGVLLGVLVTRPAYGDVLRNLMVDDDLKQD